MKRQSFGFVVMLSLFACGDTPEPRLPTEEPDKKPDFSRVANVYADWGFSSCDGEAACAKTFAEKAGVTLQQNPKGVIASPDPDWIPEWSKLPETADGAHFTFEALVLAAANKTYRKRCEGAYETYAKALDKDVADVRAVIAREATDPNPYDRISALLALRPAKDPPKPGEFVKGSDPARFDVECAIFDSFEATNRTFVYTVGGYAPTDALLGAIHRREPPSDERDAFCLAASRGEIDGVPALPTPPGTEEVKGMVRAVVDPEVAARLDQRRADLKEQTRLKFEKGKAPNPSLPPGVRSISDGSVTAFVRDGQGAELALKTSVESTSSSGKIERVDEVMKVTFADWPSGVTLDVGDTLSFYGVDVSVKETLLDDTSKKHHLSRESKVTGKHVMRIATHNKVLTYF
jgi:hypothetical protein